MLVCAPSPLALTPIVDVDTGQKKWVVAVPPAFVRSDAAAGAQPPLTTKVTAWPDPGEEPRTSVAVTVTGTVPPEAAPTRATA